MVDELKILADLIDYPVTILAFIWSLRMVKDMYEDTQEMLQKCLDRE